VRAILSRTGRLGRQPVYGLPRARHRRHHRSIGEPNALPTPRPGRYHWRDVAQTGARELIVNDLLQRQF